MSIKNEYDDLPLIEYADIKKYIKNAKTDIRKYALYGYMTCMVHNELITEGQWKELKKLFNFSDQDLKDIMIIQ